MTGYPARLKEVTPEEASHYIEEKVPAPKAPKRHPGFMVIPNVGMVSRGCAGRTREGAPCRQHSPWDWSPEQGPFYCRSHASQVPERQPAMQLPSSNYEPS